MMLLVYLSKYVTDSRPSTTLGFRETRHCDRMKLSRILELQDRNCSRIIAKKVPNKVLRAFQEHH